MPSQHYRGYTIAVLAARDRGTVPLAYCIRDDATGTERHASSARVRADASDCSALDAAFQQARAWIDAHPLPRAFLQRDGDADPAAAAVVTAAAD
jgi:hypothetical protein